MALPYGLPQTGVKIMLKYLILDFNNLIIKLPPYPLQ